MNDETLSQVERLADMYNRKEISTQRIEGYAAQLEGMPVEHLAVVVDRLIRTSRFFPTVAEIFDAWAELLLGPPDPAGSLKWCMAEYGRQENEAWQAYLGKPVTTRGMFSFRVKVPEQFPDPVTAEAVRLFGWPEIFETDESFLPGMWRKRYEQARELVATRIQAGEVRLQLPQPENVRPIRAGVAL